MSMDNVDGTVRLGGLHRDDTTMSGRAGRSHGPERVIPGTGISDRAQTFSAFPGRVSPMTYVLAGGCFWCLDAVYRITRGVSSVVSGYTGGKIEHPSYRAVCSGKTGHAEAVAVTFDPAIVPAEVILDLFFTGHDPTSLNRQGHDVGTQYRSAMFYADEAQKALFKAAITRTQPLWDRPIVTTLEPLGTFWEAEPEHQDFYANQPFNGYCQVIINPKLAKVRQRYSAWLNA